MYLTADGAEVRAGGAYFDNNLDLVEAVKLADWAATELEPAWHKTVMLRKYDGTPGNGRTNHSDGSRLWARHPLDGILAEDAREAIQEGRAS